MRSALKRHAAALLYSTLGGSIVPALRLLGLLRTFW
jgi:hypothetical protein